MSERLFDLNDRQKCVTAVIKVSDKEFRISRVVTGVRVTYSNMLTEMGEQLKGVGEIDTEKATKEEIQTAIEKADRFEKKRKADLDRCMDLLLTKNGYEYDRQWWQDNTDEYDVRSFIEACLSKEAKGSKKK